MNSDIIQPGLPFINGDANQILRTYDDTIDDAMHYVCWSGGCDSTLVLYELLEAYGPDKVVAISYNYPWLIKEKAASELACREAFKAKLRTRGKKYSRINHIELSVNEERVSGKFEPVDSCGLPQAVAWLLSVPLYARQDTYIYTGAIRNDDLTLHLESYHQLFEGLSGVLWKKMYLREPYLYFTKTQVLEKLFRYDLYDVSWFCELPVDVGEACCDGTQCMPCRTHMSALTELSLFSTDELIRLQAKKALRKIYDKKAAMDKAKEENKNNIDDNKVTKL